MLKDKEKKKGDKKEHKEKHKTKESAKSDKKTKTKENEGDKTYPLKNPVEQKKPNIEKSESTESLKDEDITAEAKKQMIGTVLGHYEKLLAANMVEVMVAAKNVEVQLFSKAQKDTMMALSKDLATVYKPVKNSLVKVILIQDLTKEDLPNLLGKFDGAVENFVSSVHKTAATATALQEILPTLQNLKKSIHELKTFISASPSQQRQQHKLLLKTLELQSKSKDKNPSKGSSDSLLLLTERSFVDLSDIKGDKRTNYLTSPRKKLERNERRLSADIDSLKPKCSSLFEAAQRGDIEQAILIRKKGMGINGVDSTGRTALHHAVEKGHRDMVEYLVSEGAQLELRDLQGMTALDLACLNGREEIANYLVSRGAKFDLLHKTATSVMEKSPLPKAFWEKLLNPDAKTKTPEKKPVEAPKKDRAPSPAAKPAQKPLPVVQIEDKDLEDILNMQLSPSKMDSSAKLSAENTSDPTQNVVSPKETKPAPALPSQASLAPQTAVQRPKTPPPPTDATQSASATAQMSTSTAQLKSPGTAVTPTKPEPIQPVTPTSAVAPTVKHSPPTLAVTLPAYDEGAYRSKLEEAVVMEQTLDALLRCISAMYAEEFQPDSKLEKFSESLSLISSALKKLFVTFKDAADDVKPIQESVVAMVKTARDMIEMSCVAKQPLLQAMAVVLKNTWALFFARITLEDHNDVLPFVQDYLVSLKTILRTDLPADCIEDAQRGVTYHMLQLIFNALQLSVSNKELPIKQKVTGCCSAIQDGTKRILKLQQTGEDSQGITKSTMAQVKELMATLSSTAVPPYSNAFPAAIQTLENLSLSDASRGLPPSLKLINSQIALQSREFERVERITKGKELLQSCSIISNTIETILDATAAAVERIHWESEFSRHLWACLPLLIHFNATHIKLLSATEILSVQIKQSSLNVGTIQNALVTLTLIDNILYDVIEATRTDLVKTKESTELHLPKQFSQPALTNKPLQPIKQTNTAPPTVSAPDPHPKPQPKPLQQPIKQTNTAPSTISAPDPHPKPQQHIPQPKLVQQPIKQTNTVPPTISKPEPHPKPQPKPFQPIKQTNTAPPTSAAPEPHPKPQPKPFQPIKQTNAAPAAVTAPDPHPKPQQQIPRAAPRQTSFTAPQKIPAIPLPGLAQPGLQPKPGAPYLKPVHPKASASPTTNAPTTTAPTPISTPAPQQNPAAQTKLNKIPSLMTALQSIPRPTSPPPMVPSATSPPHVPRPTSPPPRPTSPSPPVTLPATAPPPVPKATSPASVSKPPSPPESPTPQSTDSTPSEAAARPTTPPLPPSEEAPSPSPSPSPSIPLTDDTTEQSNNDDDFDIQMPTTDAPPPPVPTTEAPLPPIQTASVESASTLTPTTPDQSTASTAPASNQVTTPPVSNQSTTPPPATSTQLEVEETTTLPVLPDLSSLPPPVIGDSLPELTDAPPPPPPPVFDDLPTVDVPVAAPSSTTSSSSTSPQVPTLSPQPSTSSVTSLTDSQPESTSSLTDSQPESTTSLTDSEPDVNPSPQSSTEQSTSLQSSASKSHKKEKKSHKTEKKAHSKSTNTAATTATAASNTLVSKEVKKRLLKETRASGLEVLSSASVKLYEFTDSKWKETDISGLVTLLYHPKSKCLFFQILNVESMESVYLFRFPKGFEYVKSSYYFHRFQNEQTFNAFSFYSTDEAEQFYQATLKSMSRIE